MCSRSLYVHESVNSWDEPKRQITLAKRGLDFADAELVFAGKHFTRRDERRDYGEPRFINRGMAEGTFRRSCVDAAQWRAAHNLDEVRT